MPLNNTSNVTNFYRAFANTGITAMPNIDTSGAHNMANMFEGCKSLPKAVTLDVSSIFAKSNPDYENSDRWGNDQKMLSDVFKGSSVEEVTLLGVDASAALDYFLFGSRYELQVIKLPEYMGVKKVHIKGAKNTSGVNWEKTFHDEPFDIYD